MGMMTLHYFIIRQNQAVQIRQKSVEREVSDLNEGSLTRTVEGGVMSGLLEHPDSEGA